MSKHYQEIVDEVFNTTYPHRTLRTLFDLHSSEWDETDIDKKIEILKRILDSERISFSELLRAYKRFYKFEINKAHVVDSLPESLAILLAHLIKNHSQK